MIDVVAQVIAEEERHDFNAAKKLFRTLSRFLKILLSGMKWRSVRDLGRECNVGKSTAHRAVKILRGAGLILRTAHYSYPTGKADEYMICEENIRSTFCRIAQRMRVNDTSAERTGESTYGGFRAGDHGPAMSAGRPYPQGAISRPSVEAGPVCSDPYSCILGGCTSSVPEVKMSLVSNRSPGGEISPMADHQWSHPPEFRRQE